MSPYDLPSNVEQLLSPLLMCKNPLAKIKEFLHIRKEAYANCDLSFNIDGLSVHEVVLGFIDRLNALIFI
ncbi:MAG: hypothetical protein LBI80_05170 [Endomicrobium sp.]|jgi:hypothetical protein|nr:hypothetical protein [Endomicrobium sp.]